jgi:hypothetical protein
LARGADAGASAEERFISAFRSSEAESGVLGRLVEPLRAEDQLAGGGVAGEGSPCGMQYLLDRGALGSYSIHAAKRLFPQEKAAFHAFLMERCEAKML